LQKSRQLESIGKLAGGIAHDFNNLITIILGNVELAKQWNKDEEIDGLLEESVKAIKQAQELITKLLTFSKGGFVRKKIASIKEIIDKIIPTLKVYKRHKVVVNITEDLPPVPIDVKQMKVVFEQLLENALDAIEQGGTIVIDGEVVDINEGQIPNLKKGRYAKITITDSGSGIPPEIQDKIFDPYFTTKKMGNKKGTGMGLSTCYSILKKHNGAIILEKSSEVGTSFAFYLPYDF
jgi:signal transduction histidine kinase